MTTKFSAFVLAAAVTSLAYVPTANAAPTVSVGPGTGWSHRPGAQLSVNACSFTALGRDNANRLVAITAGHCHRNATTNQYPGTSGQPVYKSVTGEQIGWFTDVYTWNGQNPPSLALDYQVIRLNENVVIPSSTSENGDITVTSFGTASLWQNICKNGISTGLTCGLINGTSANSYASWAFSGPGDSGSPAVKAGTGILVGYTIGSNATITNFVYNRIQPVLADMNARGSFGAGFTLVQ